MREQSGVSEYTACIIPEPMDETFSMVQCTPFQLRNQLQFGEAHMLAGASNDSGVSRPITSHARLIPQGLSSSASPLQRRQPVVTDAPLSNAKGVALARLPLCVSM